MWRATVEYSGVGGQLFVAPNARDYGHEIFLIERDGPGVRVVLLSVLALLACKPPGSDGEVTKDTTKPLPWSFRYGLNMGHRNANWGDDKDATLGSRASAQHSREAIESLWLPERVTRTRLSPTEAS